jgi:hypothetical protein
MVFPYGLQEGFIPIYNSAQLQLRNYTDQLVEALRSKPEGRSFNSRFCHWNFSLTYYFWRSNQPLTEMSTRNISLEVKAAGA